MDEEKTMTPADTGATDAPTADDATTDAPAEEVVAPATEEVSTEEAPVAE